MATYTFISCSADVTSPSRFGGLSSDEMDRINSQLARYRKSLLGAITDIDKIQVMVHTTF